MKKRTLLVPKSQIFAFPEVKAVTFGLNSFRSLGPWIWRLVPDEPKAIKSLNVFKEKIKGFEFKDCPYTYAKMAGTWE